ncbi:hypothetical protein WHR41_09527 [Cladosporium halotolerans]|uniref:tyrosinase n=1 Tax=Cladosporium halotolerans TaxID=1052096 RepID=A0AB34KAC0_9PEZI
MIQLWETALLLALATCSSAQSGEIFQFDQALSTLNQALVSNTGSTGGEVGYRREIHALQENEDEWNIYLLGFARFKEVEDSEPMSYYQIAAIHGQPYVSWDNDEPCDGCSSSGYCTHQSTLFPTWHRAYMALFEQALSLNAMSVAKQVTGNERGRYVRAAQCLRLPSWDWANLPLETADSFPRVFTDEEMLVSTPSGRANITNPLKSYVFRPNEDHSFMNANETYRRRNFTLSDILQLRADLWATLSSAQTYPDFSTEARLDGAGKGTESLNPSNLDAIHDHVHVLVGGNMSVVTSGF